MRSTTLILILAIAVLATVCVSGAPTASSKILQLKSRVEAAGEGSSSGEGEGPFDNIKNLVREGAQQVVTQVKQGAANLGNQIKTSAVNEAKKVVDNLKDWWNHRNGGGAAPPPPAAAPLPPVGTTPGVPCVKAPTYKLPVKMVGVADQLPGDKEANEKLIEKAHDDILKHKARIIKEKVLQDSYKAVETATDVQDRFHQFQAKVLRETTLPSDKKK